MRARKSWQEKLADSKGLPKVQKITRTMSKRWGTGTVVIPAPQEVDAIMKKVPRKKRITINEIRAKLAKKAWCDNLLSYNCGSIFLYYCPCCCRRGYSRKEEYYTLLANSQIWR